MLKRKMFIKHNDESNEQFENRINEYLKEDDALFTKDNHVGHYCHISNDGSKIILLFHHETNEETKKQIGF